MHNAPGTYSKYAPRAVWTQIMPLEHVGLKILIQITCAPGACSICSWSIILGQNLTEAFGVANAALGQYLSQRLDPGATGQSYSVANAS